MDTTTITEKELRELAEMAFEVPVLSIYLNTSPTLGNADDHRTRLRAMLKRTTLNDDAEAVLRYFEQSHPWSGRGVAVFSAQAADFFRVYTMQVSVRDQVWESKHPYVRPLVSLFDAYGYYGVVLIDKTRARFFLFHLGVLTEQDGFEGQEVRQVKAGGGSSAPGRRVGAPGLDNYIAEVVERNMREAAHAAMRFFTRHKVRRILLGGSEENVALFRKMLPKRWQSLIVGAFPMEMRASHAEVWQKAMEIGEEAERKQEARLLERLQTEAARGGLAVLGLDETLGAVHEGRAHIVVVEEGYRAAGYRCTGCGFLTTQPLETCPFCGSAFEEVPDAVELVVRKALDEGTEVEMVPHTLEAIGHIGALLRY